MGTRGRKPLPANILEYTGKSHKTKAELQAKRDNAIRLGDDNFVEPGYVADNEVAHLKWLWIIELYRSCPEIRSVITVAMTDQIANYCMLESAKQALATELTYKKGSARQPIENRFLKVVAEQNKIGKDLLLDLFSQQKVRTGKQEKQSDPIEEAGLSGIV